MTVSTTRTSTHTRRSQVFAVLLLVFMYVVQPALVIAQSSCADTGCSSTSEDCCCVKEAQPEAPVVSEPSCCSQREQRGETSEGHREPLAQPSAEGCECRTDSTPAPTPEPALPLGAKDELNESSASEWLRIHSAVFTKLPCELPEGLQPPGRVMKQPAPGVVADSPAPRVSRAGAWTLLLRGVSGLLAVIAVSRS